jgi:AcrR family transcriptional regulator
MARNRFDNLDPERKERMLAAAADEFAERGYAGASLGRIIEAAGISKGMLYYYFNDKEDLFATTIEVALDRLIGEAAGFSIENLSASSYWDALRDVALRSVALRSQGTWFVRLALAFPRLRAEPEASLAVRPALEWGRRFTEKLLVRGRELGTVRRDVPLGLLIESTLAVDEAADRWFAEHHTEYDEAGLTKLVEVRVDLLRDMLDASHEGWNR